MGLRSAAVLWIGLAAVGGCATESEADPTAACYAWQAATCDRLVACEPGLYADTAACITSLEKKRPCAETVEKSPCGGGATQSDLVTCTRLVQLSTCGELCRDGTCIVPGCHFHCVAGP